MSSAAEPEPTMLNAALAYAARGWRVFPVAPGAKVPLIPKSAGGNGCHDATTAVDIIREWWTDHPDAGIGLHCGPPSGVFVLDVDVDKGGQESLDSLEAAFGPLPETLAAKTGSGGSHFFFRCPADRGIRNKVKLKGPDGKRLAGLDVRSGGGYVVLPPSRHPNGNLYAWAWDAEVVDPPAWLLDLVSPVAPPPPLRVVVPFPSPSSSVDPARRYAAGVVRRSVERISQSAQGNRHDAINLAAYNVGQFSALIDLASARADLIAAGLAVGKDASEVERTVDDGLRAGAEKPRDPPGDVGLRTVFAVAAAVHAAPTPEARKLATAPLLDPTVRASLVEAKRERPDELGAALLELGAVRGLAKSTERLEAELAAEAKRLDREERIAAAQAAIWGPPDDETTEEFGPNPVVMDLLDCREVSDGVFVPIRTLKNLVTILERDPRWSGAIKKDLFSGVVSFRGHDLTDDHERETVIWVDTHYKIRATPENISHAIHVVASRHSAHPVREYLEGLTWDGSERAMNLLHTYFGAADTPLHAELSWRWLVSCVARIFDPGCQVDTTLVLTGAQGAGKTSAFRILAGKPEWYSGSMLQLNNKDAYSSIRGVWIYELAELRSLRRSDADTIKAFLTECVDKYRPAYGRNDIRSRRQNVFVGTTNDDEFLVDATGSRRFWPVAVSSIDLPALLRDRDNLWAEAVALYKHGLRWWLPPDVAVDLDTASAGFRESHPWLQPIEHWLDSRASDVTVFEVLDQALQMPPDRIQKRHQNDVADILKLLGWSRSSPLRRRGRGGPPIWVKL